MTIFRLSLGFLAILSIFVMTSSPSLANEQITSAKDRYHSLKVFCGRDEIPLNETSIPWIGCLYMSSGHKAAGEILGYHVEVSVNNNGDEIFYVDEILVEYMAGDKKTPSGTNLSYVHIGGTAGILICKDDASASCPSRITVHSRNEDRTILFSIIECLPPDYHRCVTNQTNWDYEIARADQASQQRVRPVAAQTPLPPGPFSSWPEEVKKPALASLGFRCGMVGVMAFGNYQGPKEAAKEMVQALAMACTDHQMPEDWPGHAEVRTALKQHYDAALGFDPKLPDPVALMSHLPPG